MYLSPLPRTIRRTQRLQSSPWRCGPGIQRIPDAPEQIATIHCRNKLLFRAFHQWQYATLCARIRRIRNEAIELRWRQCILRRVLHAWHSRTEQRSSVRRLCTNVRRLRLCTLDAIWQQSQRCQVFDYRTAVLVYVVRFGEMRLCRRIWNVWRSLCGSQIQITDVQE